MLDLGLIGFFSSFMPILNCSYFVCVNAELFLFRLCQC